MLEFTLEAVQPSEGKLQEEMRAQISLVPLRLRLDQAVIKFFAEYIDSIPSAPEPLNQIPLEDGKTTELFVRHLFQSWTKVGMHKRLFLGYSLWLTV